MIYPDVPLKVWIKRYGLYPFVAILILAMAALAWTLK